MSSKHSKPAPKHPDSEEKPNNSSGNQPGPEVQTDGHRADPVRTAAGKKKPAVPPDPSAAGTRRKKRPLTALFDRYSALLILCLEPVLTGPEPGKHLHVAARRLVRVKENRMKTEGALDCVVRTKGFASDLRYPEEPDLNRVVLCLLNLMSRSDPTLLLVQDARTELPLLLQMVRKVMCCTWGVFQRCDLLDLQTVLRDRVARPEELAFVLLCYGMRSPVRPGPQEWEPTERAFTLAEYLNGERADLSDYINRIGVPADRPVPRERISRYIYLPQDSHARPCPRGARLPDLWKVVKS